MDPKDKKSTAADEGAFAARLRWLEAPGHLRLLRGGLRGVEKESLRVRPDGKLSHRPHPRAWGAALTHPHLTTDYSESLPEFVTPPLASNWETLQFLCDLHVFAHRHLDDELLWPASMPCLLNGNDEIPIADYGSSNPGMIKTVYRRGLGYRYGRSMQAIAGVHFNYSLPSDFWPAYRDREGAREPLRDFRSERFMGLVRNYRRCSWLITYLFGASPALSKSFKPEGHELLTELDAATWYSPFATSLRMSDLGYRNKTQGRLAISANSLAEYVAGLTGAMSTVEPRYAAIGVLVDGEYRQLNANLLQIENEYYSSIRPKPSKASSSRPAAALRAHGVEYVEVRTLDLSPADPVGINQTQLRFLEALLVYCLLADSAPIDAHEQAEIDSRDITVARDGRRPHRSIAYGGKERPLAEAGLEIVGRLEGIAALLDADGEGYLAALDHAREALREPERTPAAALLRDLAASHATFVDYGLALARSHADYFARVALAPARAQDLEETAARSLAEAAQLERSQTRPFADYLRDYLAAI